ncbi:MAG: serine/threonine-protein kinase [Nannocystaceae bacterium]
MTSSVPPRIAPDANHDADAPIGWVAALIDRAVPPPARLPQRVADWAQGLFLGSEHGPQLVLGSELGPFVIERHLGRGGQAMVLQARHKRMGPVALKVPYHGSDALIREARLASQIEHPCIVRVEDIQEDERISYLVMELCEGGSLADLMHDHREGLAEERVLTIADQLLDGLACAHDRGVVHRDIKASNVMFDRAQRAKLSDLGIGLHSATRSTGSVLMWTETTAALPAGTPAYMAPEQRDPDGKIDERADLYAFGKLLYLMLTGNAPTTIRPVSACRPDVSPRWDAVIFALVEDERSRRPPDVGALRALLPRADPTHQQTHPSPQAALSITGIAAARVLGKWQAGQLITMVIIVSLLIYALGEKNIDIAPQALLPYVVAVWTTIGLARREARLCATHRMSAFLAASFGFFATLCTLIVLWHSMMYGEMEFSLTELVARDLGVALLTAAGYWKVWPRLRGHAVTAQQEP